MSYLNQAADLAFSALAFIMKCYIGGYFFKAGWDIASRSKKPD